MRATALCRLATATMRELAANVANGLCLGLLAAGFAAHPAAAADDAAPSSKLSRQSFAVEGPAQEGAAAPSAIDTRPVAAPGPKHANFERERASPEARYLTDWVDNRERHTLVVAITHYLTDFL